MAKRRKKTAKRTTKRKGIRGFGASKSDMTGVAVHLAETVGGLIVGTMLQKKLASMPMLSKPNAAPIALVAIGGGAAMFMKNPHIKAIAAGVAAAGGLELVKKTVPGIGEIMIGDTSTIMENIMIGEDFAIEENSEIADMVVEDDDVQFSY